MGKVNDMLDEIMSDLGISDELARSIRQTEEKSNLDRPAGTVKNLDTNKQLSEKTVQKPVQKATQGPVKKTVQRPVQKAEQRPVQKTTQRPVQKTTQRPVQKTVEKSVPKPVQAKKSMVNKRHTKSKILRRKSMLKISAMSLHILINIVIYTLVVIAIVKISEAAFDFAYQIYGDVRVEGEPGQKISFEIDEGATSLDVAKQLQKNDLIIDKYAFLIRLKLSEKEIYANTYMLSTSMSYDEIIDIICNYKSKDSNKQTNAEDVRQP